MLNIRRFLEEISIWIEKPRTWKIGITLGVFVSLFFAFPYLLKGGNSIIEIHDNLDSDLVWFHILSESPHTFSFSNDITVDPFMGGKLPRNALPPALNGVTLLFSFLSPITAYLTNFLIVRAVGIISMYAFLVQCVLPKPEESAYAIPVALAYGLLPYHGLHPGIAVSGLPIVALSLVNLHEGRWTLLNCSLLVIYGLYSSLLYVGMFVLIVAGTGALWRYFRGYTSSTALGRLALGGVLLTVTYVVAEWNLINLYFFSDFVSHREEYNPVKLGSATDFIGAVRRSVGHFLSGQYHAPSLHSPFLLAGISTTGGIAIYRRFAVDKRSFQSSPENHLYWLLAILGLLTAISFLYGFWNWIPFVRVRYGLGALSKVQFNRFYWLFPFLWSLAFAIGVAYLRRTSKLLQPLLFFLSVIQLLFVVYSNGELKRNYANIAGIYDGTSYKEFYSQELFNKIKNKINRPPESYRVVSVGLFPDIAAYNGFYTLDSYQRLYPLNYKRNFRKIIAPELRKSDEIRRYFDYWGSRCYMFSSDLGKNYFIPKSEAEPINIYYNIEALKDMGGDFIISSVQILNTHDKGISFISSFENKESPYKLHLYSVEE